MAMLFLIQLNQLCLGCFCTTVLGSPLLGDIPATKRVIANSTFRPFFPFSQVCVFNRRSSNNLLWRDLLVCCFSAERELIRQIFFRHVRCDTVRPEMGFMSCSLLGSFPGRLTAACEAQVGNFGVVEKKIIPKPDSLPASQVCQVPRLTHQGGGFQND